MWHRYPLYSTFKQYEDIGPSSSFSACNDYHITRVVFKRTVSSHQLSSLVSLKIWFNGQFRFGMKLKYNCILSESRNPWKMSYQKVVTWSNSILSHGIAWMRFIYQFEANKECHRKCCIVHQEANEHYTFPIYRSETPIRDGVISEATKRALNTLFSVHKKKRKKYRIGKKSKKSRQSILLTFPVY